MAKEKRDGAFPRHIMVEGVKVPTFLYGTAWKEERTKDLVRKAIEAGYRGIDTANQRRHYFEAAAGEAVHEAIASGLAARKDLFLQTKFTYLHGQDHRLPYEANAHPSLQARQSLESSLHHFRVKQMDSFVLHGPSRNDHLAQLDLDVWKSMEDLRTEGKIRLIGISNVNIDQLEELCDQANTTPAFVQNRCFASNGWDLDVRIFCKDHGIRYQGFSLLTANVRELNQEAFHAILNRIGRSAAQVVFRFALQAGIIPLTGTTDPDHMRHDLEIYEFELSDRDMRIIEEIGCR